ncbi:MAG: OmpA family protein [Sulfuricurvum sp.]|nr:OmpA family protein [Sulfuricurvum sp.]
MEPLFIWTVFILSLPFLSSEPKTTVVLLDNDSAHNAIDVSTQAGKITIDKPYDYTTLNSLNAKPSEIKQTDADAIREKYSDVLNALPTKAVSMLFYFEPGTADITQASKDQIEELINTIKEHQPASIDIIGHSDRAGDADKNYVLALERAKTVENFLIERKVDIERRTVLSYGENDPIVPTEDGVSEPLNRRVEVTVR